MKKVLVFASLPLISCLILSNWRFGVGTVRAQAPSAGALRPQIAYSVRHDVSPPLRDMRPAAIPSHPPVQIPLLIPKPATATQEIEGVLDPVGQQLQGAALAAPIGLNFEGQSYDGYLPPDANGAAGSTDYVQWVNTNLAIYNKDGGLVYGPVPGNTIWSGFGGPCETYNSGDPIVRYDRYAQRWILTQPVFVSPYYQCVAVSTTSDPTGSYNRYSFSMPNFPDYPKLGVWVPSGKTGAYYMTWNMWTGPNGSFLGARQCALDRNAMLTGQATAGIVCVQNTSTYPSILPADMDGPNQPPSYAGNYEFNLGNNQIGIWDFNVDFSFNPPHSSDYILTPLNTASFVQTCSSSPSRNCVAEPNTSQTLDALSDRLMYRAPFRQFSDHESVVLTHSVQGTTGQQDDYSGIRWYEIRVDSTVPSFSIYQQGTFKPDTNYRWMGSIAQDAAGDMGLGFSLSSNVNYPSIFVTGRTPADPLGTMEKEAAVVRPTGAQVGSSRWGDYDSMSVDPVDDCTFWYTNEYLPSTGLSWHTRIVTFKFPTCP